MEYSPFYYHSSITFVEHFNRMLPNRLRYGLERSKTVREQSGKGRTVISVNLNRWNLGALGSRGKETVIWKRVVPLQRHQGAEANWRTRGKRMKWKYKEGDRVWMCNTKSITLRDKLETLCKGPGILLKNVFTIGWEGQGTRRMVWVRHSDMLRLYSCEHPNRIQSDLTDPATRQTVGCKFAFATASYKFQQTHCGCLKAVPRSEEACETKNNTHKQQETEKSLATRIEYKNHRDMRVPTAPPSDTSVSGTIRLHLRLNAHPLNFPSHSPPDRCPAQRLSPIDSLVHGLDAHRPLNISQ